MSEEQSFVDLQNQLSSGSIESFFEKLISLLQEKEQISQIFEVYLMQKKHQLGLPLVNPTSFEDVPEEHRTEFENWYIDRARDVGQLFLDRNEIPKAWIYFRIIGETSRIQEAFENLKVLSDADEQTEELINIALYEGAHPVKGIEMLLRSHGTCNTVTALDQIISQLTPEQRDQSARILIRELYDDLAATLRQEVQQRMALAPPGDSIHELITGREWLFAEGNYHIDVSHLNAVVRFARALSGPDDDLQKAIQLAEYGSNLDSQFQYPGEPPFDQFYESHLHFLKALGGIDTDHAISYFKEKLKSEADEQDRVLIVSALIDLLMRIDRNNEAVEVAKEYADQLEQLSPNGFSMICQEADRFDVLQEVSQQRGDLIGFAAALLNRSSDE